VGVVGGAVALQRRQHAHGGVGRRQGVVVAAGGGGVQRPLPGGAAGVRLVAQEVDRGGPCQQQRLVGVGGAVQPRSPEDLQGLLQVGPHVVDQAGAPGQPRRQLLLPAGGAAEALQGALPVPLDLAGLALDLLDGAAAQLGREPGGGRHDPVGGAGGEHGRAVLDQEGGGGRRVLAGHHRGQRLLQVAAGGQPGGRPPVQLPQLGGRQRHRGERHLADQVVEHEPAVHGGAGLEEQAAAGQPGQHRGVGLYVQGAAQLGGEAAQRRDPADQRPQHRVLAGEHLLGEVGEQQPARPAQRRQAGGPLPWPLAPQRLDRQAGRRRPAAGHAVQRLAQLAPVRAEHGGQQRAGLLLAEGEQGAVQLQHLAAAAQPLDRERRLDPGRQHQVEQGGRVPGQPLDQPGRRPVGGELVDVVEDQHQVAAQLELQRLAERGREAVGAGQLVGVGPQRGGQHRAQLVGEVRQPQPQRVHQPAQQRRQAGVLRLQRVPGRGDPRRPGGQ
jgi:hypothetical protein